MRVVRGCVSHLPSLGPSRHTAHEAIFNALDHRDLRISLMHLILSKHHRAHELGWLTATLLKLDSVDWGRSWWGEKDKKYEQITQTVLTLNTKNMLVVYTLKNITTGKTTKVVKESDRRCGQFKGTSNECTVDASSSHTHLQHPFFPEIHSRLASPCALGACHGRNSRSRVVLLDA